MHKPESILKNGIHKIVWNFERQMDHYILARKLDLVLTKQKRTCHLVNFAVEVDHKVKIKENEKIDKYLDLARELKKLWNRKVVVISISILGTDPKGLEKRLMELRSEEQSKPSRYNIAKIG